MSHYTAPLFLLATLLATISACSAPSERVPATRIEGNVFGEREDRTQHRFAATPVLLVPADTTLLRTMRQTACEPYRAESATWLDRVFTAGGDLMSMQLDLDSLRLLRARIEGHPNTAAEARWRERRQLSDSVQDALERHHNAGRRALDSLLRDASVAHVITGVDGHFVFDRIPPGQYRLATIAALGDTGTYVPTVARRYGLERPRYDDWVWLVPLELKTGDTVRVDLSPINRIPNTIRFGALCFAADKGLRS